MKKFQDYKNDSEVKKITQNPNEIKAIIEDSIKRFETFYKQKEDKNMTKYVFENLYESLRELAEAIALKNKLKIYSHEITISFLLHKNIIDKSTASILNNFRKLRNQSKYYGANISHEKLTEAIPEIIKIKKLLVKSLE